MAVEAAVTDLVAPTGWPGAVRATLRVRADHPILAGHFPGQPIVPGVLLLDAVRAACAELAGVALALVAVDDARFTAPLLPEQAATLDAVAVDDDGAFAVAGAWTGANGRIATFRVRLAADR